MTAPLPLFAQIGPLTITSHALAFLLGALLSGWILARLLAGRFGSGWVIWERVAWIFIGGVAGARFLYLVVYLDEWHSLWDLIQIWEGGLISFGGILAGIGIALWQVRKESAQTRLDWISTLLVAALPGWAVGRIGTYLMGEAAGVPANWGWLGDQVPVALGETLGCLLLFGVLLTWGSHWRVEQRLFAALGGYLFLRFGLDFWRAEPRFAGLLLSQYVSLAGLVILLVGLRHALPFSIQAARNHAGTRRHRH